MTRKKVVSNYYIDINNLTDILTKLVSSYRLLVGAAGELNSIALAKKKDVKDAIKRSTELGDVIDEIIEALDKSDSTYLEYCKMKSEILQCKMEVQFIETEIDEELKLKE